jgi:thioredoxin reductase (NADPH)
MKLIERFNLTIVGAGPAGLSAGIYGSRMGLETLVLGEIIGGMASENVLIENYPGFIQISGLELGMKMHDQAKHCGAVIRVPEKVETLILEGAEKEVKTSQMTFSSDAVILATGCTHRRLGVPGEEEFRGRGVSYCATCDGPLFKGKRVMVIGGGNSAVTEALYLSGVAEKVYIVHRRDDFRADAVVKKRILESGVEILWKSCVQSIEGDNVVRHVKIIDDEGGKQRTVEVDGVFIAVGEDPQSELAVKAGVNTDPDGYILVNQKQETNIDGVYAAGDVTGGVRQIGTAVGGGIAAAVNAYLRISGGWYKKRV